MDNQIFDSSSTPVDFDLTPTIPGWGRVLPEFNNAIDFIVNNDGTVTYNDPGIGIMFLPLDWVISLQLLVRFQSIQI